MKKKMQGSVNFRIYKFPWFAQFFFFTFLERRSLYRVSTPSVGFHTQRVQNLSHWYGCCILQCSVGGKKKTKTNANMKGSRGAIFKRFAAIPQRPPLQSFRSKTSDKRESSLLSPFPGINPFINMSRHTQISRIFQAS